MILVPERIHIELVLLAELKSDLCWLRKLEDALALADQ